MTRSRKPAGLPSREQVLEFIRTTDGPAGKREIAREFGLKGQEKISLKKLLAEMAEDGLIDGKKSAYHRMGGVASSGCHVSGIAMASPSSISTTRRTVTLGSPPIRW